jgi:hypothetical protein
MANALQNWGNRAPVETNTTVTELAGNRVQVEACDPEMIAGTPDLTSVDHVVDRQLARLAAG